MGLTFKLGFQVDTKELESSIGSMTQTLQRDIQNAASGSAGLTQGIAKAAVQAGNFQKALERATTTSGQISFATLNKELQKTGTTVDKVVADLAAAGPAFEGSFRTVITSIASADRALISVSGRLKEMKRVMTQSVKFTLAQSIQRELIGAVRSSITWVKELDSDLTKIAVVSAKSAQQMERVYDTVLAKSKDLKVAASDYAEAALIFYQQGLPDAEVERRSDITIKAAKAAGVATEEMSSQLTAIWNTYKMAGEEQERAASVGAKMAAETAVDFADIAEAMQSSASAAAQMGVSYNSLAAIIATVGDTTQQSASTIGNAYKTIFSRFEQLKSAGSNGEVTLNRVSAQLAELGISVLDSAGELRQLDDVINEVGNGWDNWTKKQQLAIAELVGGTRQYGQFLALMNNFEKYQNLRNEAEVEDGSTLEQQYSKALESIDEKQARSVEAWRRAFRSVFDTDAMKGFYDGLTKVAEVAEDLMSTFGGMKGIILTLGSIFAKDLTQKISIAGRQFKDMMTVSFTKGGAQKLVDRDIKNTRNRINAGYDKAMAEHPNDPDLKYEKSQKNMELDIVQGTVREHERLNKLIREGNESEKQYAQMQKNALENTTQQVLEETKYLQTLEKEIDITDKAIAKSSTDIGSKISSLTSEQERMDLDQKFYERAQSEATKNGLAMDETAYWKQLDSDNQARLIRIKLGMDSGEFDKRKQEIEKELEDLNKKNATIEVKTRENDRKKQFAAEAQAAIRGEKVDLRQAKVKRDDKGNAILGPDGKEQIEQNDEAVKRLTTDFNDLINSLRAANGDFEGFEAALEEAFGPAENGEFMLDDSVTNVTEVYGSIVEKVQEYNALAGEDHPQIVLPEEISRTQQAGAALETFGNRVNGAKKEVEPFKFELADAIGAAVGFGMALTQCVSVFTNFVEKAKEGEVGLGDILGVFMSIIPVVTSLGPLIEAVGLKAVIAGDQAFSAWLKTSGSFIAIIALVAALTVGIVALIKYFNNFTPEAKLKKAQEAAEALATAEEEAKQKADNLRAAFEKYESAKEKLDSCKRGTEEWSEALKEANDAALELLDNLPSNMSADEIKSLYTQENGMLTINKHKVEEIQKTLDVEAAKASYAADVGKINAQRASNNLDRSNIANDVSKATQHYDSAAGATVQQSSAQINKIIEENLKTLSSIIDESEFKDKLGELGVQIEYLDDNEIAALQDSLAGLAKNTDAVEAKFDVLSRLKTDEILGEDYDDAEKNYAAAELSSKTDELYKDYLGALTNGKMAKGANDYKYGGIAKSDKKINDQLLADYNELTGNNYKSAKNGVTGNDAERFFVFWDEQQQKEIRLSAETVAQQMAAAKALESLGDSAKEARINLNKLEQASNEAKFAIETREKSGDTSGATKEETQAIALSDAVNGYLANGNMNSLTQEQLQALNGDDAKAIFESLAPELRAYFGEGEEAFTNYQNAIEASLSNITDAAKNSRIAVQDMYKSLLPDIGNVSADTADVIVEALDKSMATEGKDGMDIVKNIITGLGENGAEEFKEIYEAIDWTKPNVAELTQKLKDGGYNADYAATMADALTNALKSQAEATLDATQAEYAATQKIIDGLDDYDIISPEEIETLQKIGVATDAYFQELADGTFMLTADASEFKNIVNGIELGKMQEVVTGLQDKYDTLSKLSENGSWSISANDKIKMLQENFGDNADVQDAIKDYQNAYDANNGAYSDNATRKSLDNASTNLNEVFNANFTTERINNELEETIAELDKAQKMIREADFQNDVKKYGLDLKETTQYAKSLAQEMGISESRAKKLAIANQRLDRGLIDLNENLEDYKKALDKSNKGSAEYSKTMAKVKGSLADVLNIADGDMLSDKFVEDTLASEDLTKALDGDVEAIQRLQTAVADDIIINIAANHETEETPEQIQSRWEALKLAFEGVNLEAPSVEQGELLTSFNEMIKAGKMTKDEIEAALTGLHVSADIKTEYHEVPVTVPTTITDQVRYITGYDDIDTDMDGKTDAHVARWRTETNTHEGEPKTVMGYVPTYSIDGTTGEGGEVSAFSPAPPMPSNSSTTSGGAGGNKGGGGGNSKPKKFEKAKYHERFTDTKQQLDTVSKSLQKYQSAINDSWGPAKIANINKVNSLIAKQGELYKKLYQEAKAYADADKLDVEKVFKDRGLTVEFDEDGSIKNLEDLQKKWEEKLNATDLNGNGLLDESEQDLYDAAKEAIDKEQDIIEKYAEAITEMNEALQNAVDNVREYMSNKLEAIKLQVDLDLKPTERAIKHLEDEIKFLGRVGLETGKVFEKMAGISENTKKGFDSYVQGAGKITGEVDKIQAALTDSDAYNELLNSEQFKGNEEALVAYLNENKGVPGEYLEELENISDSMYDKINEQREQLADLYSTYAEVFQTFISQFEAINQGLETNAAKLDLFQQIYEASGDKSTTRKENELKVATAKRVNAESQLSVAKSEEETWRSEKARRQKDYDDFIAEHGGIDPYGEGADTMAILSSFSTEEAIMFNGYKENLDEATSELASAEQNTISKMGDVLTAATEEQQKKVELARAKLVESITGGLFNDMQMLDQYYNDLKERNNFYLDDYDKDYNLDKFDYQIDDYLKDADITDPSRLKEWEEFQERINALREDGVQLTQDQIDKLQAEFELEKLKDQYEEAQNAKTTMRLTRDASGNYNYVYSNSNTEDAEDIAQKIKDKEKEIRDMGKSIIDNLEDEYMQATVELDEYLAENGGVIDDHALMLKDRMNRLAKEIQRECDETGISFGDTSLGMTNQSAAVVTGIERDTSNIKAAWTSMEDFHGQVKTSFIALEKAEEDASTEKEKVISDNCDKVGIDYKDMKDDISEQVTLITNEDQKAAGAAEDLRKRTDNAMTLASKAVKENSKKICDDLESMWKEYQRLIDQIKAYQAAQNSYQERTVTQTEDEEPETQPETTTPKVEKKVEYYYYSGNANGKSNPRKFYAHYSDGSEEQVGSYWGAGLNPPGDENGIALQKKVTNSSIKIPASALSLDTGGYTGDWPGEEGKMAILHKKEIVLNAEDTANILEAVREVRASVNARTSALNNVPAPSAAAVNNQTITNNENTPVQQDVKIDATFPNVNVASEVEDALTDLINKTAQYAKGK